MHSKPINFKNYKFSSFNNGNNLLDYYGRPLNNSHNHEFYGQLPIMPYSLQNLLLLDNSKQTNDQTAQFQNDDNSQDVCLQDLPTPPPPPQSAIVAQSSNSGKLASGAASNLKSTLVKQRSLAAIDLDQYTDAHIQHHLQTLAHQLNQLQKSNSRQLSTNLIHRTVSNDNFDKCNFLTANQIKSRNPELLNQTDLIFSSQDYSPDLDVQYATEDNQTG